MATISLNDAKSGYAAKTTASRDATGKIVGNSTGSNYARAQETQKQAQEQNNALKISTPEKQAAQQQTQTYPTTSNFLYPTTSNFLYGQKAEELQKKAPEFKNTSGAITIDTSEETVRRAKAQGLDVSLSKGKMVINSGGEATKSKLEALHKQTYAEESEKWKGALSQRTTQVPQDSLVNKVASSIGVKSQLDTANKKVSGYIPSLERIQEIRDTNIEKVGLSDERQKVTNAIRSNKYTAGLQDYYVHGYQGLKETPASFAAEQGALVVGAAVGGAAIKGAGIAGRVGLTKIGLSQVAGAVEPAVNVGLGATVVYEATKIKSVEEGAGFVTDFAIMGAGYKVGSKAALKTHDTIRTKGLKEVQVETLVKESVISGKETFPMTKNPDAHAVIDSFRNPTTGQNIGYHATTSELGSTPSIHGVINPKHLSDVPGLYVSPIQEGASPNFLRMGGEYTNPLSLTYKGLTTASKGLISGNKKKTTKGLSDLKKGIMGTSDPLTPNVLKISLNNVERLPENIRYGEWIETPKGQKFRPIGAQKYLLSPEAPKGTTFLTPVLESKTKIGIPAEAEAVIVPETTLTKTGESSYFAWGGRRVKLQEYKVQEPNTASLSTAEKTIKSVDSIPDPLTTKGTIKETMSAGELTKTYRAESPGSKGLISEIAYPAYHPYTSAIITRANIPGEGSRSNILNIDSRATIPNIDSKTIDTRTIDNRAIDNRIIDGRTIDTRTIDNRAIDNRIIDGRTIDTRTIDNRIIDNRIIDGRTIDTRTIDNRIIDNRAIDTRIIDNRVIDNRIIDNHIIDNRIIDNRIIDNREIDNQIQGIVKTSINLEIPDPLTSAHKLKKPKQKMLKNVYGDPFSTKTKL